MGFFGPTYSAAKAEVALNLCAQRIRLQINKRDAQIQQLRKEIAELMRKGRMDSAKIKVEAISTHRLMKEALEKMGLYCELLAVRAAFLERAKFVPSDMVEAVATILYAGIRLGGDIPEMTTINQQLVAKVGKEAAQKIVSDDTALDNGVNERVVFCLTARTPSSREKFDELKSIITDLKVEGVDVKKLESEMVVPPPPPYPSVSYPSALDPAPVVIVSPVVPAAQLPPQDLRLEPGEHGRGFSPVLQSPGPPSVSTPVAPTHVTVEEARAMAEAAAAQARQQAMQAAALARGGSPVDSAASRFPTVPMDPMGALPNPSTAPPKAAGDYGYPPTSGYAGPPASVSPPPSAPAPVVANEKEEKDEDPLSELNARLAALRGGGSGRKS